MRPDCALRTIPAVALANDAFNATFGLLAVFGGIGLLAAGLVAYAIAQVLAERGENQRMRQRRSAGSSGE